MVADYNGFDKGLSSMNCNDFVFISVMLCPHNYYMQYVNQYCKIKVSHTLDCFLTFICLFMSFAGTLHLKGVNHFFNLSHQVSLSDWLQKSY